MHCQYCHERLSIFKLLSGQPFCSKEHRELYLNTQSKDAIKRLLSSFGEEGEVKRREPAPVQTPEPLPSVEVAVVSEEPPEPPEASFLLTDVLPLPKSRPAALISKTVIQPPSGQISFPTSPRPEPIPPERVSPEPLEQEPPLAALAALEIELAPAKPAEAAPQPSAHSEQKQDVLSIVSASAADVVSLHETVLMPLPAVELKHGAGVEPAAIDPQKVETPPGRPALLSTDATTAEVPSSDIFIPPPPAASSAIWPAAQEQANLPVLDTVSALRPRSPGPRTPVSAVTLSNASGLRRSDATEQLPQPPAPASAMGSLAEAPLAPYSLEPCSPAPTTAERRPCSLAASTSLYPASLPVPAECTTRTESPSVSWQFAVGATRFPQGARALPNIQYLAGPADVKTSPAAKRPPAFQFAPSITGPGSVRLPLVKAPSDCSPFTLALSAEALPSPKPPAGELPFQVPTADFCPSFSNGLEKAKLPRLPLAGFPPKLWITRVAALYLPSEIATPDLPVRSPGPQVNVSLALPEPSAKPWRPAPIISIATREIGSWSANWITATSTAAPRAAEVALRYATTVSIPAATNTVAASTGWFTIEPPEMPPLSPPAALHVPLSEPVSTPLNSRALRIRSSPVRSILRSCANIRRLWPDDALAKQQWAGQPSTRGLSHLEASRPSPLSLLTAPRARSTAVWVATLEHPQQAKLIPWSLVAGQPVPAQLFLQTNSGRRVGLPHPEPPSVSFGLPALTTASPLVSQALPPGNAGTQQIPIAATRIEPAGLSVLPGLSKFSPFNAGTALRVSGALPDRAKPFACKPGHMACLNWEIRTKFEDAIPRTNRSAYPPALCLASYSGALAGRTIAPPSLRPKDVPVESFRQRLSRALSLGPGSLFPLRS